MNIIFLTWDSDFFGFKVGKINIEPPIDQDEFDHLIHDARKEEYKLIYLFNASDVELPDFVYSSYNCNLVDRKVVFGKKISLQTNSNIHCRHYLPDDNIETLYSLAFAGGAHSRYKSDPLFPKESFQRLYKKWIDNSILRVIADDFFIYESDTKIVGLLTVKYTKDMATIGLLAVDERYRGKKIGKTLIGNLEYHAAEKGCHYIQVATQGKNSEACSFYEKIGMMKKQVINIDHLWV
ncbi:MAG: GNAT family N-acetyltransferase [Bacteroidia bacterium]|nr:GNAT family N-acetyltransferase [Bacteroidia bacterium]